MIALGWSRLEARDPRLKGWSEPHAVGPTGSTVTVASAERCMTGRGMFQEPALLVCLRILTPEGHVYYHDRLLTRPSKFDLWSLSGLSTYVTELIGEAPPPHAFDE